MSAPFVSSRRLRSALLAALVVAPAGLVALSAPDGGLSAAAADASTDTFLDANLLVLQDFETLAQSAEGMKILLPARSTLAADVVAKSDEIVRSAGATTDLEKVTAIYNWFIENTYYDYNVTFGFESGERRDDWQNATVLPGAYATTQDPLRNPPSAAPPKPWLVGTCGVLVSTLTAMLQAAGVPAAPASVDNLDADSEEDLAAVRAAYEQFRAAQFAGSFESYCFPSQACDPFEHDDAIAYIRAGDGYRLLVMDPSMGSNNQYYRTSTTDPETGTRYPAGSAVHGRHRTFYFDMTTQEISDFQWMAQPTAHVYRVLFDARGGSAVAQKSAVKGAGVGSLSTPTWTGHTFSGWYTAATGGTKVTAAWQPSSTSVDVVTLYAHWDETGTSPDEVIQNLLARLRALIKQIIAILRGTG
jgi:uncharacterized repeat protein (TIGR02543 family)